MMDEGISIDIAGLMPDGFIMMNREKMGISMMKKKYRMFGLCPIRYKNCGHFFTLEWSCGYQIFSFLLPCFLGSITLWGLLDDFDDKVESETDQKKRYLASCDISTITIIVLFCIAATPGKIKSFWKICQNFNQIEKNLIVKNPTHYRKVSILFISSVLLIYTVFYLFDILSWHTNYEKIDGAFIFLRDYVPFYLLKYIMLNEILFFCHMIYFTKIRLASLNQSLRKIINERIFEVSSFHNGEIKVIPPISTYDININDTASRVTELTKTHRKIFEVVQIINSTVEFGILVIMFCILVHLVMTPYFLFSEIAKGKDCRTFFVVLQCMWIIAHTGKFIIIMETSHQCISEADDIFIAAQTLFAQERVEKTKNALLSFIMQLVICKIRLNVIGLFRLDRSLLTAFVASITTYLVVLLQELD